MAPVMILRKMKIAYSLIAVLVIASVTANVYFYLENRNLSNLVTQNRLREMWEKAEDIWSRLTSFVGWYYDCMWRLQSDLKQGFSAKTEERLIWRTSYLLERYSDRVRYDVERDFNTLSWSHEPFRLTYVYISNAVEYALDQTDWATRARKTNESYELLWELYYILGADQITRAENLSRLRGIANSFSFLSSYWRSEYYFILTNGRQKIPSYLPKPETALDWALGNATALHQALTEWHERTERIS